MGMVFTHSYSRRVLQDFAQIASVAVTLIGCLVLAGWMLDITTFKSVLPGLPTMKANAALCFILAGVSLLLFCGQYGEVQQWLARACALVVALVGLVTLSEDVFGWDFGIDQLLFTEPAGAVYTGQPGRIAPVAALNFILVGLALLILDTEFERGHPLSQFLIFPVVFIALLALTGYVYDAPMLYTMPPFTGLAVHAVAMFLLLSAGIIVARPDRGLVALLAGGGSVEQKILGGFGLAGALLIGVVVFAYQSTLQFRETSRLVAHSHEVLTELETTLVLVKDAGFSHRGYVITGDERYVEAYDAAVKLMPEQLKRVRGLTADNAVQQRRLDSLEPLIAAHLQFRDETLRLQRTEGISAARRNIMTGAGTRMTNATQQLIREMEKDEHELLARRSAESEQSARFAIVVIVGGSLLALAVVILASMIVKRAAGERTRAHEALRESEALLRAVLEHSPAMIYLKDTNGRYLLCNREFEKISQAPSETVIGKTDEDLFPPEQAASFHAHDRKVLETGVSLAFEAVALHGDGPHTSMIHKFPLRDAAGKTYAIGGIVIDITQRKRMEELLRALSLITEKLHSTFDMEILLDELVREAMRLVNAEGGCAGLRITQGMTCNKYFQESEILPLEYCWPPGHDLPGWVLKYKVPYLANDTPNDQQFLHTLWDKFGVRSALSVPILDDQREVLGFFQLHNKRGHSGFTPSDQTTLMLVAQAAASAIQRTMAFQSIQLAEKSLRESEERFRSVVESATDAIVQTDQRGHILSLNKAALRFFGYTAEELLGKPLTILMPVRYQAAYQQGLERLRTTGESRVIGRTVELHGLRKDGSEIPLELSLGRWKAKGENFFSGIMRDVTAQKMAQQHSELLQQLIASVKDYAIFTITPQGLISSWNEGAERMKGYRAEEILGQHFSRFYPPEDVQAGKPQMALHAALAQGRWEEAGLRVRKDGSTFWTQAIITALKDDAGQLRGFIKITQDVTEQRRAQQALAQSFDQLRALSQGLENAREDERTRIAQEVHDELGGTLSYLKLDLTKLHAMVPSVSNREAGSALRKTIASMIQLLDNTIETVRRIATALRPGVLDDFGLVAAIEWLAQDFQKRSGITCTFQTEVEELTVEKESATALFRICQEALTNVVRHARADRVAIRLAKTADQVLLEIKDNGQGIHEAKIAHSRSLGLVGMRERTARLGGEFQIKGIPKKGTTVTARVPLTRPKTEENMVARDVREPGERRLPGERIRGV